MDDDGYGSGLSGWAWHELGQQAEQAHQGQMEVVSAFAARLRGHLPVNIGAVMAENQALWQQNQELQQQKRELWSHNQALRNAVTIWEEDFETLKGHVRTIHAALKASEDELSS